MIMAYRERYDAEPSTTWNLQQPDWPRLAPLFAKAIEKAVHRRISAVNYVEAAAVFDGSPGSDFEPEIR